MLISIHSLVKRETGTATIKSCAIVDFNPLPRKEGDKIFIEDDSNDDSISIHSLVKRETANGYRVRFISTISIHSLVKRETDFQKIG